jgi:glutamate decarboxylase
MADMLVKDIQNAVVELERLEYPTRSRLTYLKQLVQKGKVYTH